VLLFSRVVEGVVCHFQKKINTMDTVLQQLLPNFLAPAPSQSNMTDESPDAHDPTSQRQPMTASRRMLLSATVPPSAHPDTIFYKFASQSHVRTAMGNRQWRELRDELEDKFGFHRSHAQMKGARCDRGYIEARFATSADDGPISDGTTIVGGAKLVLFRRRISTEDYVKRFAKRLRLDKSAPTLMIKDWDKLSEEEKMEQIVSQSYSAPQAATAMYVPRAAGKLGVDDAAEDKYARPDAEYVCYYCAAVGAHFCQNCPKKDNKMFVAVSKRSLPLGYPMGCLRPAVTDEELARSYVGLDGRYYVPREGNGVIALIEDPKGIMKQEQEENERREREFAEGQQKHQQYQQRKEQRESYGRHMEQKQRYQHPSPSPQWHATQPRRPGPQGQVAPTIASASSSSPPTPLDPVQTEARARKRKADFLRNVMPLEH